MSSTWSGFQQQSFEAEKFVTEGKRVHKDFEGQVLRKID